MNYLILAVIVISLSYGYEKFKNAGHISLGVRRVFYALICLVLCTFAGLRTAYNDTPSYIATFVHTTSRFSNLFLEEFSISQVYLFRIWNFLIYNFISEDPNVYLLLSAAVFVFPAIRLIDKYSRNFTFSMILFVFGGMYLFSLAGLKQAMATGVLMMGLPYLMDKKYIKFYIFCLIALGFHTYSIFFFILPFLGVDVFNKRTIVFAVGLVVMGLALSYVSGILSQLIELLGKEVDEETIEDGSVNIFRAIVFFVPTALAIVTHLQGKLEDATNAEKVFIKCGLLSSAYMILAMFGNPILFGRIPQYFLIGTVVAVPILLERAFKFEDKQVITLIGYFGYTAYGIYALHIAGAFRGDIFRLIWF